ncbi:hypothetical protein PFISCL1PPCAC_22155, partial [Pristionchus fissidentatus]
SQNGRIVKRCPFGDCARVMALADHLDHCDEGEKCKDTTCVLFHEVTNYETGTEPIPPALLNRYDKVDLDRMNRIVSALTARAADIECRKKALSVKEPKAYELLAFA